VLTVVENTTLHVMVQDIWRCEKTGSKQDLRI